MSPYYKFCPKCGQSTHTNRIDLHFLIHEIQHGIFHVDKGIFYTLKELFSRPGYSIQEYIDGKRQRHFKPVLLVMILGAIFALLKHFFHLKEENILTIQGNISGKELDIIQNFYNFINFLVKWTEEHYAFYSLLQIPFISLGFYWRFKKYNRYNYAEWLVIMTFITGQILAISIVGLFWERFIHSLDEIFTFIWISMLLWTIIQLFPNEKKIHILMRGIGAFLLSLLLLFLLLIGILGVGFFNSGGLELI